MAILAKAPGKLILIGEYAVLEGAQAVVAAMDRFATVSFDAGEKDEFSVSAPVLNISSRRFTIYDRHKIRFRQNPGSDLLKKLDFFITTFEEGLKSLRLDARQLRPTKITLDTETFYLKEQAIKLGLGSSAALTVALLGAIYRLADKPLKSESERRQFFRTAVKIHRAAQSKMGSGIDIAASTFGGVLQYQMIPNSETPSAMLEEIRLPGDLLMLVVWSGKPASTKELVNQTKRFRANDPKAYHKMIDKMQELSFEACHALLTEETALFLELANHYHAAMAELGEKSGAPIVTPAHQTIAQISRESGAAYKPSGAGGGDMGIVFSDSQAVIEQAGSQIEAAGFRLLSMNITPKGVYCHSQ